MIIIIIHWIELLAILGQIQPSTSLLLTRMQLLLEKLLPI